MGVTHTAEEASSGDDNDSGDLQREVAAFLEDCQEDDGELTKGDVFELLMNRRRRDVLAYLCENEETTLDELATHIAAKENGITIDQLSSEQRKRVYIGLYQSHLPKLDDAGVIDYNQNRGTIELVDITPFEPYLADERGDDPATEPLQYVTVGVGSIAILGLFGLGPLSLVPAVAWTVLVTIAFIAQSAFLLLE